MRNSARDEGQRWLDQAREDLKWAEHLAEQGGYHIACFLAQQVAEKALKAFLYAQGEELVIGHSVARLCAAAQAVEPAFSEHCRSWAVLDGFYIPTRYPNGLPGGIPAEAYPQETARDAVALARQVVDFVASLLD
jgi:HEPN domain-containing protein